MKVGILMGSKSDMEVMKPSWETLEDFGIETEVSVISAHRAPKMLYEWASTAKKED